MQSDLTDSEVLHTLPMQKYSAPGELPIESVHVGLLLLCKHHDGPHAPVEIVQHHAILGLLQGSLALNLIQSPGGVLALRALK